MLLLPQALYQVLRQLVKGGLVVDASRPGSPTDTTQLTTSVLHLDYLRHVSFYLGRVWVVPYDPHHPSSSITVTNEDGERLQINKLLL